MNCKETPAMFACKSANAQELADLFGDGWDMVEGGVLQDENFKCNVVISSVSFKFLKAQSTLSICFRYERWHWKRNTWVPLQARRRRSKKSYISTYVLQVMEFNSFKQEKAGP